MEYIATQLGLTGERSASRPSFLQVAAHQSTHTLLLPFLKSISEKLPGVSKHGDKIAFALLALIEAYHLVKYSGGITERMYGFKRSNQARATVTWIQLLISLLDLVGLPYLKSRLDAFPEKYWVPLKRIVLAHDALSLLCKLGYIYDRTDSFSLLMLLGRIKYLRTDSPQSLMPFESWIGTGLFLVRFVEWWKHQSGLDLPPVGTTGVPEPPKPSKDQALYPEGKCGLCMTVEFVEPVSVPSGIVFCSPCLNSYLSLNQHRCPVSRAVLKDSDIVPIFLQ